MKDSEYKDIGKLFKVLSDPVRLQIIDLISCKEMCACEILEFLSISQSTLSHHMKVLKECGIVTSRKDATWVYYSIVTEFINDLKEKFNNITSDTSDCFCYTIKIECKK
ncbi:MAG: metalloregulator ArsR/SmtB family transcription factor [Candidatus Delongbacteria bacterium]|nr:metalloregulator ArsR/SmtB family transcription factor [Candidatus Delongbacteria bacterium]MCG2761487.1 metalloregulator ArsR/SmtB family transcription factor [Candidatus Delongbacteria bacterium]